MDYLGNTPQRLKVRPDGVRDGEAHFVVRVSHRWVPVPPRTSAILGDAVYNARAALNLAVCDLVKPLPNGHQPQFPIRVGERPRFHDVTAQKMGVPGMSAEYVEVVYLAQPFLVPLELQPSHPLALLKQLADTDKHQDLLTVTPGFDEVVVGFGGEGAKHVRWIEPLRVPPKPGTNVIGRFVVPEDMADELSRYQWSRIVSLTHPTLHQAGAPAQVVYPEAASTLTSIYRQVEDVLKQFRALAT